MFRIVFPDLSFIEEERAQLCKHESCFKHAAELGTSVSTDRSSANKEALQEYLGSGIVCATGTTDRSLLLDDLKAWAVPLPAWPVDLRLQEKTEMEDAARDLRLAYQRDWVSDAVHDLVRCVSTEATELPFLAWIVPDAGRFTIATAKRHFVTDRPALPAAVSAICAAAEARLHLTVHKSCVDDYKVVVAKPLPPSQTRSLKRSLDQTRLGEIEARVTALEKKLSSI